ncbi:MAG: Zn-dependent hydrolase [Chloroflexi bacterium]|nr:Zn-dependent hydrolase [Chloroflexota bacterium]
MRVNGRRLNESLRLLAEKGATSGGGVSRLALSDEDRAGRDLLRQWMGEAGLRVRIDDFGNMTGHRPGSEAGPAVLLGSHCDSVRGGGRYDGAVGVMGALEVIRTLNDNGVKTRRPLELVNWTNEEGARFEPAMLCSGAAIGRFTQEYVYDRADREGLRFGDELRRIGYLGREEDRPGPASAYLELHIEQGPALEEAGVPVGVVEGIVGITWQEVTLEGQTNHAGSTPMRLRHDALAVAARIITGVDRLTRELDSLAVGTVGRVSVEPNIINVIPGKVVFSVDFRHPQTAALETLAQELEKLVNEASAATRVTPTVNRFWTSEPTPFAPEVINAVQSSIEELGLPYRQLWSGAGHDAKYMADVYPTSMIFVRSKGGLSHCEQEYSAPEDIEAGANSLLLAATRLAGI